MKLERKILLGTLGLWLLLMAAVTIGKTLWPGYPWETLTAALKQATFSMSFTLGETIGFYVQV